MYKSILLPVDLHQESSWKNAIPVAIRMAKESGADIHILTVIPDYGMAVVGSFFPRDYAENAMQETDVELKKFVAQNVSDEVTVKPHVRHGSIYKEIINSADEFGCDLIVLASHRPETKDYLLGPNAARVVRHASQSVFVVRD